jgi:hypothetical protein
MSLRPKSADELLRILRDPRSVPDVRTYFNLDRPDDPLAVRGARFLPPGSCVRPGYRCRAKRVCLATVFPAWHER